MARSKHLNIGLDELEQIVNNVLIKGRTYYHCSHHGVVYAHKNRVTGDYEHPVIDVFKLTGETTLHIPFEDYNVTSGVCKPCYEKAMSRLRK